MSIPAPDFWDQALCTQTGHDLFFSEHRGDEISGQAKRVCALCDVRETCLEWALSQPAAHDQFGVFGGLAPHERREVRRQRREAA